jgi:Na+/proline symporter
VFPFVCSVECLDALLCGAILTFLFFSWLLSMYTIGACSYAKITKQNKHKNKQEHISTVSCLWWPHPWFQLCLFSITIIAMLILTRWLHGYELSAMSKSNSISFISKRLLRLLATIIVVFIGPNSLLALAALGAADEQADRQGRSKASGRASGQQQTDERH